MTLYSSTAQIKIRDVKLFVILFLLGSIPAFAKEPAIDKYSAVIGRFAVDVCFAPDIGNKSRIFRRLQSDFSVKIATKDLAFEKVAREKINQMVSITGLKEKAIEAGKEPTVTIYAGSISDLKPIAQKSLRGLTLEHGCGWCTSPNIENTTTQGSIFICLDKLDRAKQEKHLQSGLMFVWGVTSHSDEFSQSFLSESATSSELQPLDIRLLKFLYSYVPSNTNPAQLRDILRENWEKMPNCP